MGGINWNCSYSVAMNKETQKLIYLHNQARDEGSWMWDIMPLVKSEALETYAQEWAEHMASVNRMYHSSLREIMQLGFLSAGENIAWGAKTAEQVMKVWLHSRGHKANIMSSKFSCMGAGMAQTKKGKTYWCVCFGTPSKGKIGKYE